jgi:hypothetical protein
MADSLEKTATFAEDCPRGAAECFDFITKNPTQPSRHNPRIAAALVHPHNGFGSLIEVSSIFRIAESVARSAVARTF